MKNIILIMFAFLITLFYWSTYASETWTWETDTKTILELSNSWSENVEIMVELTPIPMKYNWLFAFYRDKDYNLFYIMRTWQPEIKNSKVSIIAIDYEDKDRFKIAFNDKNKKFKLLKEASNWVKE